MAAALGARAECPVATSADDLRLQASVWRALIDPDGVQPDEERAMQKDGVRVGDRGGAGVGVGDPDNGDRAGHGVGWIDGLEVPVSLRTVRQMVCSGGTQSIVLADNGRVRRLGTEQRCFDGWQRRAITLRDGGCVIPGCRVPASWCEIHHVVDYAHGGATHTDNGVLLCWFHHRTVEHSGWEIRMRGGVPQIKAPPWIDRHHRRWSPVTSSRTRLANVIDRT